LWDILIKALVNRYEAEFPEQFKPREYPKSADSDSEFHE